MLRFGCTIAFLLVLVAAQAQNNFRSRQTGDWNQSSTWEEFIAGSWQLTSNTPDATSGTITLISPHAVTVTANVTADQLSVSTGSNLIINDGINLTINNGLGTDFTVDGTLQVLAEGFVSGNGSFVLNGFLNAGSLNAAGAIVTGTTEGNIRTSAVRVYNAVSRTVYNGTAAQFIGSGHTATIGSITEINNASGVTFNETTIGNSAATTRLAIAGDLLLTSGNLNVVGGVGGRTLELSEDIIANGNFITVSGAVNLSFNGSGDINPFPFPPGTQSLGLIVITRPSNTITFNSPVSLSTRISVSGNAIFNGAVSSRDLFLVSGTVDFNAPASFIGLVQLGSGTTVAFDGTSLSMSNDFQGSGLLACSAASTLSLTGTVPFTSPLNFAPGSSLQSLTVAKNTPGVSATIGSQVTVSSFNLLAGTLSNTGGSLTMTNGGSITKAASGVLTTSSPSGGPWNLTYTGSSQSTGLEIPASGILSSLTVNTIAAATVTLTQNLSITGSLTVNTGRNFDSGTNDIAAGSFSNSGTFDAPSSGASTGLTLNGNFVNNGTFDHNGGTVVVAGNCTMSGTSIGTTNFSTISISSGGTLTAPTQLNIAANLSNAGSFTAGSGTVVFNGAASALLGANMPTTAFNSININTGATLTQASNLILTGNLIVNGALTVGAGTTTFAGSSSLTGTNIATTQFNQIVINPASTLIAPTTTMLIGGNFTNNGTFTPGTSTTQFTGSTSLLGTNINTTNFNNVIINGLATLVAPATFNILGNWTNNGTFTAGTGTVSFNGNTGGRTISGTTNTQFYHLRMNKSNGGTSVTTTTPQTVTNALTLADGIMDIAGGTLSMNNGTTLTRVSGASILTTPTGGPWHMVYEGTNSIVTSVEIQASGTLLSLSIDVGLARNVSLSQSINVQNAITIFDLGRSLICGTHNVTAGSIDNGGTFSAPTNASVNGLVVSGDFTNDGTYTHNNGLITFSGTSTILGSAAANFNRLTITGTLTAGANYNVASHFTNNGTYNAGTGLLTFNGSALQNIQGSAPLTTFRSLRVTNTASPTSVSLQVNANLIDSLTLGANAKFDADGSAGTTVFTLLSTSDAPAQDAKICRLPAGAVVQGSVTVQRFFRPADNFDRFISSPVTNATVAMVQAATPAASFPVTGDFPGSSFPCTGCNNNGHNLRYYYEPETGIINRGYKGFILATTNTLTPGVGYDAFMWNGVSNTTVSLRGPINSNTVVLGVQLPSPQSPGTTITRTNNGVPAADGWNLVGNPYPSPIQWNNGAGWSRSNIDPTVWVWDVVGRVWHSFNANTLAGDLTNGVIASGQGFWVQVLAVGAGSITVNEQAKSFGVFGTGSYYRTASAGEGKGSQALRISLTKGESTDNSFIVLDPQATLSVDQGLDAPKLQLGIERVSISLISEGRNWGHMAIGNELPEVLPLSMSAEDNGPATISFEVPDSYAALAGYYLVDTYLSQSTLVGSGKPYAFDIIAGDPSSQGERFYLSKYPLVEKSILSGMRLTLHPNPVADILHIELNTEQVVEMTLLDYAGRPVFRINPVVEDGVTRAKVDVSHQPTGLYVLKVQTAETLITKKIVIAH